MWAIAGHNLTSLSAQQLVDCDHLSNGCGGGFINSAYDYIKLVGGLESYESYPYPYKR